MPTVPSVVRALVRGLERAAVEAGDRGERGAAPARRLPGRVGGAADTRRRSGEHPVGEVGELRSRSSPRGAADRWTCRTRRSPGAPGSGRRSRSGTAAGSRRPGRLLPSALQVRWAAQVSDPQVPQNAANRPSNDRPSPKFVNVCPVASPGTCSPMLGDGVQGRRRREVREVDATQRGAVLVVPAGEDHPAVRGARRRGGAEGRRPAGRLAGDRSSSCRRSAARPNPGWLRSV